MRGTFSKLSYISFLSLLLIALFSYNAMAQEDKIQLRLASAAAGASLYPLGTAMVEDLKNNIPEVAPTSSNIPTSGPIGNVILISEGKRANIGFSFSDLPGNAWIGAEPYKNKIQNIRNVATFYRHCFQFVVWADSNIKKIEDLKGKRVSPYLKGMSAELFTRKVLAAYGMSYKDMKVSFLGFNDAPNNMRDGHLDALLAATFFYPQPAFMELNSVRQIRLLPLDEDKIQKLVKENMGIERFVLPPNTYTGVDYPVPGIAARNHLIVRDDMPENLVYKITKVLAENLNKYQDMLVSMKQVTPQQMATDVGIPFHPGALKYYKEKGFIK